MGPGGVKATALIGSAKGSQGWFPLEIANAVYLHPFHDQMEQTIILDFSNPSLRLKTRLSLEMSPASARNLVKVIEYQQRTNTIAI